MVKSRGQATRRIRMVHRTLVDSFAWRYVYFCKEDRGQRTIQTQRLTALEVVQEEQD